MGKTKKSPNTRELMKLKTKARIVAWAQSNGWKIRGTGRVIFIGDAKCTFDDRDNLLMVE